jgi:hypothetical protein
MLRNGLKAAWRNRRAPGEANLDDEFYKEWARYIRELADKADPFIRKRLLDLAGNYDSMVRRSPRTTIRVPTNLPNAPARE